MATVEKPRVEEATGDDWVQVPASWGTYIRLLRDRGERSRPRYIFNDARLTIVSPGFSHEQIKMRTALLLYEILGMLRIRAVASGSTTLKKGKMVRKGVEGDNSYYFTNLGSIKGKKKLVMGVDPPPDLEIEVVVSHPVADALAVHAAFGVREVWVCGEGTLTFLILQSDGHYEPSPVSLNLPVVQSAELREWLFREVEADLDVQLPFREWVRMALAPRLPRTGPSL